MVKSIGIDSAATNLSWSSVSKSAGLKSSITIFLHTFTQSRKSDMLLDQSVKSSEGSFAFRPRSQRSRFWTDCIRLLAFPAKLCTSSAVKLVRWLPDWILETIGFRCETLRQFCVKLLRPVIAWLTTYDHWLLLRNFSPVSGVKFYGEYLTTYDHWLLLRNFTPVLVWNCSGDCLMLPLAGKVPLHTGWDWIFLRIFKHAGRG